MKAITKSAKIPPAAKQICGWEEPAICASIVIPLHHIYLNSYSPCTVYVSIVIPLVPYTSQLLFPFNHIYLNSQSACTTYVSIVIPHAAYVSILTPLEPYMS